VTKRERDLLALRFMEIEAELAGIRVGRVVDGAPADVEFALLMEQDEIEFELGADYIERRDGLTDYSGGMLSLTSEYALSVMAYLAGQGPGFCKVPILARAVGLSEPYAFKVVTSLEHAGLVVTLRGRNGGAKLSRKHQTITLLDVVNAVSPLERIPTPASLAQLDKRLDALICQLAESLATTTLADVAP
jgi:Rrf2 family nitric oxide-sensitive transcriptional repressor